MEFADILDYTFSRSLRGHEMTNKEKYIRQAIKDIDNLLKDGQHGKIKDDYTKLKEELEKKLLWVSL